MFVDLIIAIIHGLIFGFVTKSVIEDKGYDDNWFWWGFFFGLIALIVACAKPRNIDYSYFYSRSSQLTYTGYQPSLSSNLGDAAAKVHNEQLLANGGWKCSCGEVQASYVSSCSCGKSKSEVKAVEFKKKQEEEEKKQAEIMDEHGKVSAIREYKELMDAGIISQEEFEANKKQLLGL